MAKEIQMYDGLSENDHPIVPKNNSDDIEDGSIETRTQIYLDGQFAGQVDEPLVKKTETTRAEEGLVETTEIRFKTAHCGHVVHIGSQAGLRCVSCNRLGRQPSILCSECAKDPGNICYVCNSICCWKCRDERQIDGEKRIVCKACIRTTVRLRLIKEVIKWLLVAASILYLIMF